MFLFHTLVGVACPGLQLTVNEFIDFFAIDEILEALETRLCGCVHVDGNIDINMEGLTSNRILNETDFNFFYHLEQISGALFLNEIPETTRIILPNLRIIRGQQLLEGSYAMIMRNVNAYQVVLPKLTEISQGSVLVEQPEDNPICNWASVNWLDIIDNGNITQSFVNCAPESKLVGRIFDVSCRDL